MEAVLITIGTIVALFGMLALAGGLGSTGGVKNPPVPSHLKAPGPPRINF